MREVTRGAFRPLIGESYRVKQLLYHRLSNVLRPLLSEAPSAREASHEICISRARCRSIEYKINRRMCDCFQTFADKRARAFPSFPRFITLIFLTIRAETASPDAPQRRTKTSDDVVERSIAILFTAVTRHSPSSSAREGGSPVETTPDSARTRRRRRLAIFLTHDACFLACATREPALSF